MSIPANPGARQAMTKYLYVTMGFLPTEACCTPSDRRFQIRD